MGLPLGPLRAERQHDREHYSLVMKQPLQRGPDTWPVLHRMKASVPTVQAQGGMRIRAVGRRGSSERVWHFSVWQSNDLPADVLLGTTVVCCEDIGFFRPARSGVWPPAERAMIEFGRAHAL